MKIVVGFAGAKILIRGGSFDVYICRMQKVVLVAILDWGLGHASRMVPVIDGLLAQNVRVILTGSGASLTYLQKRYPQMESREMPSEEMRYGKSGAGLALLKRALHQPGINKIQQAWIREIVAKEKINGIISDNLYGVYHHEIPSVIVTHQVGLLVPVFKKAFDRKLAQWLDHFTEVWVPDLPGAASLSGKMTENAFLRIPKIFVGNLSRLRSVASAKKDIALTALISGPEPQRSLFEKEVLKLMKKTPGRKVLIRGILGGSTEKIADMTDMEVYDFLDDTALSEMIIRSEWVVCRSGYSTLCDLRVLGAKAVVVPTPQQPEQLYLARRGSEKGWFQSTEQQLISKAILEDRQKFIPVEEGDLLTPVLKGFLGKL